MSFCFIATKTFIFFGSTFQYFDFELPDEGYYIPDEDYYIPDEGYYVPDEGYYVPDEGYYRNVLWSLNLISTFESKFVKICYLIRSTNILRKFKKDRVKKK